MVGQLDYFIGKCFDKDADGRLTSSERRRADKARVMDPNTLKPVENHQNH